MARQMKDSGIEWIGEIPADWDIKVAFQLFQQVKNKNEGLVEQNLLSLSYGKIKRRNIDAAGGLLPESFDGYNIIEKDDIVLRLTDLQNDQTSLRVGISNERGIVTSAYLTLRNQSVNIPLYLYYYLHTFDLCKGFYGMGAGVRQGLNWDGLKLLKIVLPSVEEQTKITKHLTAVCTEIEAVIAKTKATIEEYKKLKQSIITEAVTKGIRGNRPMKDSGIDWIGEIPSEWDVSCLKRYCRFKTGVTPSTANSVWFDGDWNWFTPCDFNDNYYLTDSQRKLSLKAKEDGVAVIIPANTVVIIGIGGTAGKIGLTTDECSCNQQITALLTDSVYHKYLMYWMVANTKFLKDTALYTTLPILNNETIGEYLFVAPTNKCEQKEIADYLDQKCAEIDTLIAKKTALLEKMETYKKSVIYEYVTGKKEVER